MSSGETDIKIVLFPLLIIIPIPTISILFSMEISQGWLGNSIFILSKIALILIPLYWFFNIEKKSFSLSPLKNKFDLVIGAFFGVCMSFAILIAWLILGGNINQTELKDLVEGNGLTNPKIYLSVAIYWTFLNSFLEEFIFRWFIYERFEIISGSRNAAFFSAAAFTLHHSVAMSYMFPLSLNIFASIGVFLGGLIWSFLFIRYRSIWVVYLSHIIVDIMVFSIAGLILLNN